MSERSKKVKEYDSYYRAAGFKTADQVAREEREYRTSRLKRIQEEERLSNTPAQQYAQERGVYTSPNRRRLEQRTELDNAINNKSAAEEYKKKYNLSDEGFHRDAEYRRNEINTQFEEAKSKPGTNSARLYAERYGNRDYKRGIMPTPEREDALKPTSTTNRYGKVVTENPDNVPTYTKQGVKVKEKEREKREVQEAVKLYANLSEDDRKDLSVIDQKGDFVDSLVRSFGHYNDEPGSDEFVNDELARGSKSDAAVSRLKSRGYTDSQIKAMSILYRQEQNKKFNDDTYMPAVEKFAEEHPVGASIASVAMKPIMAPAGVAGKAQERMNARYNDYMGRGVDSNNPLIAMAAADNDVRQKVIETQDMSKFGSEAYMMGMSTADTLVNMAMGMMFGGALVDLGVGGNIGAKLAAKYPWYSSVGSTLSKLGLSKFNPISGSIFGLSAQADALRNPNERLAAKDQLSTAAAAMVFETLCESVSIGNLDFFDADVPAKTIGQLLTQIFIKNGIPNGTEEAITNLSNKIYDAVHNKENSEYNILIEDYLANNPGATEKEARKYALSQMGVDILRDFIGGYIQGAALGGAKGAVNFGRQNISYGREGKQLRLGDDYSEGAIANTLEKNGYGKQTSASLAKAITDAATGKQMSQRVQDTINSSEFLTQILNETRAAVAENTETFREAAEDIGVKSPKDTNRSVARAIDLSLAKTAEDNQVSRSDLYKEFREQGVGKIQSAIEARRAESIDRKLGKESLTSAEREAYEKESTRQALENAQSRRFAENENEIAAKQRIINTVRGTSDIKNNVSSTGRVTVKGTDNKVKNYKITDVDHDIKILTDKNGKKSSQNVTNIGVEVTFADGSTKTVSSDDIYFASTEEARAMDVIDSVCQRTDIDTETANFLLASLPSVLGNTSIEAAVVAIKTAYDSGKYDLPLGMYGEASVGVLGVNMFNAIRQSGASVSLGNTQAADEAVKKSIRAFVTNPSESVKGTVMFRGKQITSEMIDNDKSLSDAQKDALRTQMIIADVTGIKIVADESTEATRATTENGWFAYDKGEGGYVIHADMNSGVDGQGAVLFTMAHELTHFIKTWSPTQFDNLANFALNHLGEDFDIETSIKAQQDAAARAGEKLSRAAAYEEVICNAMQTMLSDDKKTVVSRLAELNKENPELFNKLQSEINRIGDAAAKKHKELEKDRGAISNIGRAMAQVEDSIGELRSMFAEALQEAGKNFKAAGGAELNIEEKAVVGEFDKLGKLEVDKSGDLILATNENDSTAMYSYRTWDENGRDQLISLLESKGHTQEEVDKVISQIEDAADYLKILAAGDAKNAGYDALADHLMADIVTDVASGKQIVSALVPNGDYPVNIDLALICKKRVAYMKLLNYLVNEGVLEDVKFGGEAIADVNKILRDSGFETACLGCFVESRRLQIQTWAETIAQEWNAAVDNVRKNAPYFNFADKEGAANLTDDEIASLEGWLNQQEQNDKGNVKMRGRTVADKMVNLLQDLKDSGDTKALNALARKITVGDLITPQGLTKLRSVSGELFSLVKSRYGAASPKIVQDFNPYNSEIAMMTFQAVKNITGKSISGSKSYLSAAEAELADSKPPKKDKAGLEKWNADVQNLALQKYFKDIGGIRIQSFSDFMIENVFDYLQIVADLSARDFTMHGYTKESVALRLFGMTGIKWNGSLIAHVDPKMGKEYAGLMPASEAKAHRGILVKVDGKEYSIGFDDFERHSKFDKNSFIQSIGYKDIVALQCDKRYSPYVGSICIGVSDKQIRAMLDCDLIRMIIPYHSSGMLPEFAKLVGVDMYTDYTLSQNTKFASVRELNGEDVKIKIDKVTKQQKAQLVVGKKDGKDVYAGSKQIEHFAFNAKVQELGDAKAAADAYLAWCKEEHPIFNSEGDLVGYGTYEPKFSQFSNHKNYYKLLEDFNSYDSVTGASAVQDAVKMNLPSKENKLTAKELAEYKQALRKTGLFSDEDPEEKGNQDSEIEKYAKKAQMSFQEIIKESVDERIAYGKMTEPIRQETFEKVKDLLLEKHNRNGKRAASMKDYKKAQERKSTKNAVMPLEGAYGDKKYSRRDIDVEYEEAYYDGDDERMQQIIDEAAVDAGYKYKAYHHTESSFTKFDLGKARKTSDIQGFYFSADPDAEAEFGNARYDVYLRMRNPYIVDSKEKANAIPFDLSKENSGVEARQWLLDNGYDSVIRKAEYYGAEADEYIVLNANQIKSSEPVTYADEDEIIYPSQRFDDSDDDIRYSRRISEEAEPTFDDYIDSASDEEIKSLVDEVDARMENHPYVSDSEEQKEIYSILDEMKRAKDELFNGNEGEIPEDDEFWESKTTPKNTIDGTRVINKGQKQNVKKESVYQLVRKYKKDYSVKGIPLSLENTDKITDMLSELHDYVLNGEDVAWDEVYKKARDIAIETVKYTNYYTDTHWAGAGKSRKLIKQRLRRDNPYGEYRETHKALIDENGKRIWDEADLEGNPVNDKYAAFGETFELYDNETQRGLAQKTITDLTNEIVSDIFDTPISNAQAVKDASIRAKYENRIKELKLQMAQIQSDAKKETQQKVKEQRKKDVAYYQQRIKEIRADRDQKIMALKALRYQRDVERREFAARRDYRAKILRKYDRLQKMTTNPTEKQHVPAELMNSIAGFLGEITPNLLQEQTRKDGTIIKKREQNNNRLMDLVAAYKAIQNDYEDVYDPEVANLLDEASTAFGSKYLEDMDSNELADVNNLMSAIEHTIRRANKAFVEGKERDAFALARNLVRQSEEGKKKSSNFFRRVLWSQLNPYSVFRAMSNYEDGGWMDMYKILNEGQLKQTQIQVDIVDAFKELMDNKELDKLSDYKKGLVDVGLVGENGQPVEITRGLMLALYLHLQNEQNRNHIAKGGLTLPNFAKYYKGDMEAWGNEVVRLRNVGGDLSYLTREIARLKSLRGASNSEDIKSRYTTDIEELEAQKNEIMESANLYLDTVASNIESQLTDYEKQFLEKAKWFLNEYSKEVLNDATMRMYGFKKATEENYMPIISDSDFLNASFESIVMDASLENMGFMKQRQEGASNAIKLFDLTDVINAQLNKVSKYAGLAPAIKEFNNIYNKQFFDEHNHKTSVQTASKQRFGQYGQNYIEYLLADLQGARKAKGSSNIFRALRGNSYQAALLLNLRVSMAQAGSYPTAAAEIGWKPLMKALAKGGEKGAPISRADRELIDIYTPLLANRFKGGTKTDITNLKSKSKHTLSGLENRALQHTRALTDWISIVDTATVGRLWSAAEYYVDENFNLEKGTEEEIKNGESAYYNKVAEVFNRIVERTQPSYTTMQRPELLRNPNEALKFFTMFMTQRAQNFNLVYDAVSSFANQEQRRKSGAYDSTKYAEARQALTRTVVSQVVAGATLATMKALADALQHSMRNYKDDDDELTLLSILERIGKTFLESEVSNMIGGSELYTLAESLITGSTYYGITANVIGSIEDVSNAIKSIGDKGLNAKTITKLATSSGMILGIPASQMKKWVDAVKGWYKDIANGGEWFDDAEGTVSGESQKMVKAFLKGDTKRYQEIRESLKGENASTVKTAISNYLREEYVEGNLTDTEVRNVLTRVYGMSGENINKKLKEFRERKDGTYKPKESKKWGEE